MPRGIQATMNGKGEMSGDVYKRQRGAEEDWNLSILAQDICRRKSRECRARRHPPSSSFSYYPFFMRLLVFSSFDDNSTDSMLFP